MKHLWQKRKMVNKSLQVCLMMDCTASMTPWIVAAKERLLESLDTIKKNHPGYHVEVAFIGYRDYKDQEKMILVNFTDDHKKVKNRISVIQAEGGDDAAEDVAGAYQLAASLNWVADVRLLVHICDAPAHGMAYHSEYYNDDYPEDDRNNPLEPHIEHLADKNVDIDIIELNHTTNTMVDVIYRTYRIVRPQGFSTTIVSRSDSENPTRYFERAFSLRMTRSIERSQDPDTP